MPFFEDTSVAVGGSGTVTGTGAAGRIAFWSGVSALGSDDALTWDATSNFLGIGTAAPGHQLDLQRQSAAIDLFGTVAGAAQADALEVRGVRSRGTLAAPSAILADDELLSFGGIGYGATGFSGVRASLDLFAAENWTDAAQGTYFRFVTTPIGSTVQVEVARFTAGGQLQVNVATGTAPLAVSSTTLCTNLNADLLDGLHATAFQPVDADLTAIAALAGTGLLCRTAADAWATRTLQAPAAGLTITFPDGAPGHPTFALANDLAALEAMAGTGLVARTAAETYAQRTIASANALLTVANGGGVLGNPTLTVVNSAIDHGTLAGNADDDHASYWWMPGRSGAQSATLSTTAAGTIYGASAADQNLVLQPNSATNGEGSIAIERPGTWTTAFLGTANLIDICPSGLTLAGPPIFHFINLIPTVIVATSTPFVSMFSDGAVMQPVDGTITSIGVHTSVGAERQFKNSTTAALTGTYTGVFANPFLENTGAGSITLSVIKLVAAAGNIGAGCVATAYTGLSMDGATLAGAITTARGLWCKNIRASGAGTVGTFVGVDVDAQPVPGTLACSLRSAGATVQLRHLGSAVFGANAGPTNAYVALEVQSTTQAFLLPRMTTAQRDAMTAVDGMMIYNTTTAVVEAREAGAWVNL